MPNLIRLLIVLLAFLDGLAAYGVYLSMDIEELAASTYHDPSQNPAWIPVLMMSLGLFCVAAASNARVLVGAVCAAIHIGIYGRVALDGEYAFAAPGVLAVVILVPLLRQLLTGKPWPNPDPS